MTTNNSAAIRAVGTLLTELIDGPSPTSNWVLGGSDRGLLETVRSLSAEAASQPDVPGRQTMAGHVHHVLFSLNLLNRWAAGEENPFADADWAQSWAVRTVTPAEWTELIASLQLAAETWRQVLQTRGDWNEFEMTAAMASAVHLAYHFGEIRQLTISSATGT